MTIAIYPNEKKDEWGEQGTCQLCGEDYDCMSAFDSYLAGEWWIKDDDRFPADRPQSIIAHPDCASNLGLQMA